MSRATRREVDPPRVYLRRCARAQKTLEDVRRTRGFEFWYAAVAGWTLREIADAAGLAPSTVLVAIRKAEEETS